MPCRPTSTIGIHEHNNLSLAVANSVAAIEEGATLVDTSLAGLGAGAGNCQTEALVAVLERMGIETGVDLWTLQDVADEIVRGEVMPRPIALDRLSITMGMAAVPGEAIRCTRSVPVSGSRWIRGRSSSKSSAGRRVVVGQEDAIIEIAAELAESASRTS